MSIPSIVTVVGSGTMGPGIAAVLARAGAEVRVYDISVEALQRAEVATGLAAGVLDQVEAQGDGSGSVAFLSDLEAALSGSEFIVEAVPEKLELKKAVLADVERFVSADAIIATNTSGIPISTMAEDMSNPERFIGMHWSNPPHLIPMIEVIKGERTDDTVQDRLIEIIRAFGYEAVVEKETPASSRTACCTRSCASAWPCSTRASSRRKTSTRASSGASATSSRSSVPCACSTWRGSTSIRTCRAI